MNFLRFSTCVNSLKKQSMSFTYFECPMLFPWSTSSLLPLDSDLSCLPCLIRYLHLNVTTQKKFRLFLKHMKDRKVPVMPSYADSLTLRDARAQYFTENNFGDGGYTAKWVKVQAGPIPIYFPNTAARVHAVRFHDLHHVATEYKTTWTGEAEIGAWEIAS